MLITSLTLAMATGATGTYSFATLSPFLVADLQLSAGDMGILFGGLYAVAALSSGPIGRVADRIDPTVIVVAGSACSLLATVLLAMSFAMPALILSALFAGLAMAAANPGSNGMIAHRIPPGSRAFATGVKQSGATGTGLYLGAILPSLAVAIGWHLASLAAAVVPVLAMLTVLAGRRSARAVLELEPELDRLEPRKPSWLAWIARYAFLLGIATGMCNGFYVIYAHSLGYGAVEAGLVFAVFAVASVIARVVWARLSELGTSPAFLLGLIGVIGGLSAVLCALAPIATWLMWPAAVLGGLSIVGWNALGMVTIMHNVRRHAVGVSAARMLRAFFIGLAIGPLAFGVLVEAGGYTLGWLLQLVVLVLAIGAAGLLGRALTRFANQGGSSDRPPVTA